MMDETSDSSSRNAPNGEELLRDTRRIIASVLSQKDYDETQVPHWINTITEKVMERLYLARRPFKYMVSCAIMQRTGHSIQSATSCFWDTALDEVSFAVWPSRDSSQQESADSRMICIVTIFSASMVVGLI